MRASQTKATYLDTTAVGSPPTRHLGDAAFDGLVPATDATVAAMAVVELSVHLETRDGENREQLEPHTAR
jgi:hypothetical protein